MGKLFDYIASIRLSIALMIYSAVLVFIGTLEQTKMGIEAVQEMYFESFFCLWQVPSTPIKLPLVGGFTIGLILFLNLSFSLIKFARFNLRGIAFIVAHLSLLLLIVSGFMQYYLREQATLVLREEVPTNFLAKYAPKSNFIEEEIDLPFSVKLIKFDAQKWQSSNIHKEFSSHIEITNGNEKTEHLISMNKPLNYGGWTFYQNSYQDEGRISIIGAVKNPLKELPWIAVILVFCAMATLYVQKLISKKAK